MFNLTNQNASATSKMLEVRMELLDAKTAAERSKTKFDGELRIGDATDLSQVVFATPIFARAVEFELARKCFSAVARAHGKPQKARPGYYPSNRGQMKISRQQLVTIFPSVNQLDRENSQTEIEYSQWLEQAADALRSLISESDVDRNIIVECLLIVALRQCETSRHNNAIETLALLSEDMLKEAKQHESLAIEVLRLAGATKQAWELESQIHRESRLSHVRFGDYLRDTARVRDSEETRELFLELIEQSMDEDLMDAARDVAGDDEEFLAQIAQAQKELTTAEKEYEERVAAAQDRKNQRQEWKKTTSATKAANVQP